MSNEFGRSSRTRPRWPQDAYQDQYAYQNQDSYWSEDYYSSEDSYSSEDADQAEDADAYVYPAGAWWPWGGNGASGGTSDSRMAITYRITAKERRYTWDIGRMKEGGTNQRAVLLATLDGLNRVLNSIRSLDGLVSRHQDRVTVVNVITRNDTTVKTFNTWVHKWTRRPEFRDQFFKPNGQLAANGDVIADILDVQESLKRDQVQVKYVFARAGSHLDETAIASWAKSQLSWEEWEWG
eukprot:GHVU01190926.1.p1 GENE.GHVU01190926.1~~GHVU01190926.1.p1  ORF type:complete len:238 (+),score=25.49 GHVU01190926.1:54-767(+)